MHDDAPKAASRTPRRKTPTKPPVKPEGRVSPKAKKSLVLVPVKTKKERTQRRKAKKLTANPARQKILDLPADLRAVYPQFAALGIILPHASTGFRPYALGHQAAQIDIWRSHNDEVYLRLPTYLQNLLSRLDMQSRKCSVFSKFLVLPHGEHHPMGLLTPKIAKPEDAWKALGAYEDYYDITRFAGIRALQGYPELQDDPVEIKNLLRFLLRKPEVPMSYPALTRNLEPTGHQCFLAYAGEIMPNPIFDLKAQFGVALEVAEHLFRVCPLRHLGCHWEAGRATKFAEHFNLTHLRFPLLYLCPAGDELCFYLGSTVEDVTKHICGKANAGCERHQQLRKNFDEDEDRAKSAYVLVRIHNPNAILSPGWPCILDFVPVSFTHKRHPDYLRAYRVWATTAHDLGLYLVPGCPNTVHLPSETGRRLSPLEHAISKVFPKETQRKSIRLNKHQAAENLSNWSDEVRKTYRVPIETQEVPVVEQQDEAPASSSEDMSPDTEDTRIVVREASDSAFHSQENLFDVPTLNAAIVAATTDSDLPPESTTTATTPADSDSPQESTPAATTPADSNPPQEDPPAAATANPQPAAIQVAIPDTDAASSSTPSVPPDVPACPPRPDRAALQEMYRHDKDAYITVMESQLVHAKTVRRIHQQWADYYKALYVAEQSRNVQNQSLLEDARKELEELKALHPPSRSPPQMKWLDDEDEA